MLTVQSVIDVKNIVRRNHGRKIGFVPTMGALHRGHLSLLKRAKAENDFTIASVYLNPTQFNDPGDLKTYPINIKNDVKLLEDLDVDLLFTPDYKEIYPDDYAYVLGEKRFSNILCGASRPGHFDGVLTVVMKLFNIVGKCRAYFGEKDYQQYLLVKGMADAFFLPVEVVPCPIVREADGLAMSSRNAKLSPAARKKAPEFYRMLSSGKSAEEIKNSLEAAGFKPDYITEYDGRLFGAVFLDGTRLIDNVKI